MKNLFIILTLFLFMGCATDMNDVNRLVGAGQPLPYKEGFMDGHNTCMARGNVYYKFRKDVNRYKNDKDYKIGWDDGNFNCGLK